MLVLLAVLRVMNLIDKIIIIIILQLLFNMVIGLIVINKNNKINQADDLS